jgi:hypothetical protein
MLAQVLQLESRYDWNARPSMHILTYNSSGIAIAQCIARILNGGGRFLKNPEFSP